MLIKLRSKAFSFLCLYAPIRFLFYLSLFIPLTKIQLRQLVKRNYRGFRRFLYLLERKGHVPTKKLLYINTNAGRFGISEIIKEASSFFLFLNEEGKQSAFSVINDDCEDIVFDYVKIFGNMGCLKLASVLRIIALIDLLANKKISLQNRKIALLEVISHRGIENHLIVHLKEALPVEQIFQEAYELFDLDDVGNEVVNAFCRESLSSNDIQRNIAWSIFKSKRAFIAGPSCRETEVSVGETGSLVIFALNFAGPNSLPEKWQGLTINGSFYAAHKLPKMHEDGSITRINTLDLIILKQDVLDIESVKAIAPNSNVIYSPINYRSLYTELNAGTELLIAIFLLGFEEVKLANIDLFLNSSYPSGYKSNRVEGLIKRDDSEWKLDNKETLRSLGLNHNPAFQFSVYEYLYRKRVISCDNFLNNILSGGLYTYLDKLESQYERVFLV